ncbi:MAG: hypothetical protein JHC87_06265, partial [Thermoleophilaceae bacterium]|nr:hypothetical protein [Thermoleophilaceae bacterium]
MLRFALVAAALGLLFVPSQSRAYEYNSSAAGSVLTLSSGVTATFSVTNKNSVTGVNSPSARFASSTMFSPQIPVGTNVIDFSSDLTGCPYSTGVSTCSGLGNITITFSRPVKNPKIHITGLGGGADTGPLYSATGNLSSSTPAGATLGAVSGGTNIQTVSNMWRTINTRNHNYCDSTGTGYEQATAGCGTIPVVGTVTAVTFAIGARAWDPFFSGTLGSGSLDAFSIGITAAQDFGDAPTSYDPTQAPAHVIGDLKLGSTIDEDNASTQSSTTSPSSVASGSSANGVNGDGADEDAIATWPELTTANVGSAYGLTVPISGASAAGQVCGWIDFNRGGTFDNVNERACAAFASSATSVNLSWTPPAAATTAGITYARLRASYVNAEAQSPTGIAGSGEVEDYTLAIQPAITVNKTRVGPYADTFNLLVNATTFATAVGDGGTTGLQTLFHNSTYGTPDLTVAQNVASAAVPLTVTETATGGNTGSYSTSYSCVDATAATVASGATTSISVSIPQSTGTNARAQNITCTFTNTLLPAAPVITAPTTGTATNDTTPTLSGTAVPGSTVTVYEGVTAICSGTASGLGAWTCTPAGAQSTGAHTYTAKAVVGGNTSSASAGVTLTVDTTNPVVSLTVPANASMTGDNTPQITFSVTEANPGTSECSVDSGGWSTCTSGSSLSALADGSHTLQVRHNDAAGNVGSSSTNTFTVDTVLPVVSLTVPANGLKTSDTTPLITFSVTETNLGTTQCSVDSGGWSACTSGSSLSTLADGVHTLQVRHTDTAGNIGNSSVSTFTVDTTTPTISLTTPANGSSTGDDTPLVTFSLTEANPGTSECNVDSGGWSTCTSGSSLAALADGSHTLQVRHTDAVGQVGTSGINTFTVDTTLPVVLLTAPASGLTTSDNTPLVTFAVIDISPDLSECRVDSGSWATCTSGTSLSALADGIHTLQVRHTDLAAKVGYSDTNTFTVDTTNPIISISAPLNASVTGDNTPLVTFSVTEVNLGTSECRVDSDGWVPCTSGSSLTALDDGSHSLQVRHTDAAGNIGSATIASFTVDTTPPTVSLTAPANGLATSDNTPLVTFGVTEANPGTTECSVDGGGWATCTSGSSLSTLDDGSHTFQVRHTDALSNVGYSSLNTFTVDTVLPIVSLTVPAHGSITSDNTPQMTFGVTELNTGTSECSVDSASWAACS